MLKRSILALLASLTLVAPAGDALAGTYTVHGCRTPSGSPGAPIGDSVAGWQMESTHGAFGVGENCDADYGSAFMHAHGTGQFTAPYGASGTLRFLAPPATAISAYKLWWAGSTVSEVPSSFAKARVDWGVDAIEHNGSYFGDLGNAFAATNIVQATGLDRPSMYAFVACHRVEGCTGTGNASQRIAWFRIYKTEVVLRDATPPTGSASGSAISSSSWSGAEGISMTASDEGGGVYRALVEVDDSIVAREVLDAAGGRCADADAQNAESYEFLDVRPCPTQAASDFSLDTTTIADGPHTVRVYVEDAAGNRALVAGPVSRDVDNIPPPANTRRPVVSGTPRAGSSLATDEGDWTGDGLTYAFQWQRCQADGATCTDIAGAAGRVYAAGGSDVGSRLRVRVRATNGEGATDAFSDPTSAVASGESEDATVSRGGGAGAAPSTATPPREGAALGLPNGENASPLATLDARESGTDRRVLRLRYGRSAVIAGRLLAPGGAAIVGARLDVVSLDRISGAPLVALGDATTDAGGRFRFVLGPGASRTVRFGYRARIGDVDYARVTEVEVKVVAKLGFRLSKKRLRNGKSLRFLGKIHGPRTGHRFAEVQVKQGRRWIVVCSVRSDARGSFACAHRFTRTLVRTKYRFRARVRRQTGLPYEPAVSRARSIVVRP